MKFSEDFLSQIKDKFALEKKQIEHTLSNLRRDDPFSHPDRVNDNADSGTDAFEESEHLRIEAQQNELTKRLEAIISSESRIDSGTYGTCESCGGEIEEARLLAMPTATTCISCEKKRES